MTTPKEITATEKLLDLIRASSSVTESGPPQEKEADYPPPPLEKTGVEREFAVGTSFTPPSELKMHRPDADDIPVIVLSATGDDDEVTPPPPATKNRQPTPDLVDLGQLAMLRPEAEERPRVVLSAINDDTPLPTPIGEKTAPEFLSLGQLEMHDQDTEDTPVVLQRTDADAAAPPPPATESKTVPPGSDPPTELTVHHPEEEASPLGLLPLDAVDDPPSPSTEIAGEEEERPDPVSALLAMRPPSLARTASTAINRALHRLRPSTKTTIAIDIQPGMVHLVKTLTSKADHHLQTCLSVPYEYKADSQPDQPYTDQEFMKVLFRTLSTLIPSHGHHEIWCSYAFCNPVGLHNITIPKVADKDIANAVFWSAKRELEFDETTTLFDYTVLQELNDNNQPKIQTLVTLVPNEELDGVAEMFKNAGFPLTGLTFPAAAIQNFLNHDQSIPAENPVVYFTIRRNSSFIDIFHQGKMFFSREIKTGADSFIESLLELALKQNIIIDDESAKDYLFRPRDNARGSAPTFDELTTQFNFDGLAVIERLVRQLARTFEYCTTTFKTPPVSRIFTSGEFTVNNPILLAIENRIGIKCSVIEPLASTIFHRDFTPRTSYACELLVAAGLSLSDRQITTNFLFTYKERAQERSSNRINAMIAMVTIGLALGCGGFFAWQYQAGLGKQATIASMRQELDHLYQQEPRSRSDEYASQTIRKIGQFHHDNKERVIRFKVIALINELTKKIGPELRITDLTLDLEQKQTETRGKNNAPPPLSPGTLEFKGYISAAPDTQEFILMNLLKSLATLNLLGEPKLKANARTSLQNQRVLRFEITMKTTFAFLEPPPS